MKTIKMRRADWEKWDRALRSGGYHQAEGSLYNFEEEGFCCLGVLEQELDGKVECNNLYDEDGGLLDEDSLDVPSNSWLEAHEIEFVELPPDVYPEITAIPIRGNSQNPYLPLLGCSAAHANDNGINFDRIADAIADAVEFID